MSEARKMQDLPYPYLWDEPSPRDARSLRMEEDAASLRGEAWLVRYARLDHRLQREIDRRDHLRALATRSTGNPFAVPGSSPDNGRADAVEELVDLDRVISQDFSHLCNLQDEIWRVLGRLENVDIANMLDERYLNNRKVEDIARRFSYTPRHVLRLLRRGRIEVDRILREERPMCGYVSPLAPLLREPDPDYSLQSSHEPEDELHKNDF